MICFLDKLFLDENVKASDVAKKLYEDLMRNYDKRVKEMFIQIDTDFCFLQVRPVYNATETLNVGISLSVSQLIDVVGLSFLFVFIREQFRYLRMKKIK